MDGKNLAHNDLPSGTKSGMDSQDDGIALLGSNDQGDRAPGYISLVATHLESLISDPLATEQQREKGTGIISALDQIQSALGQVCDDDKKLVNLDNTQLQQKTTLSLLDDINVQANYAYTSHFDRKANQVQEGALWVYDTTQHIADFAIAPYLPA